MKKWRQGIPPCRDSTSTIGRYRPSHFGRECLICRCQCIELAVRLPLSAGKGVSRDPAALLLPALPENHPVDRKRTPESVEPFDLPAERQRWECHSIFASPPKSQ